MIQSHAKYTHLIKRPAADTSDEISPKRQKFDTVGAIGLTQDELACGSSSGGILLKRDGRVGSAAQWGAGFYLDEKMVSTCTGTGEQIITHG